MARSRSFSFKELSGLVGKHRGDLPLGFRIRPTGSRLMDHPKLAKEPPGRATAHVATDGTVSTVTVKLQDGFVIQAARFVLKRPHPSIASGNG